MKVDCTIVYEDEATDEGIEINSLSMRGAQREITGYFIAEGYEAVGRWAAEAAGDADEPLECSRRFKPAKVKAKTA
jgi:hypothetical protein